MEKENRSSVIKSAFPQTIPVLTGYIFLGMAYGIVMKSAGFNLLYPILISIFVYGGSLQFAAVSMLCSAFAPVQTFVVALAVQARHLFYGVSMLPKYSGAKGIKKFLLIFTMSDETFSVCYSAQPPQGVDKTDFMLRISLLDHFYWVLGTALGACAGAFIPFDTTGIDFAMTALFVVIFVEQWLKEERHFSSLLGVGASVACLVIFGSSSFLIPSMAVIILVLFLTKDKKEGDKI